MGITSRRNERANEAGSIFIRRHIRSNNITAPCAMTVLFVIACAMLAFQFCLASLWTNHIAHGSTLWMLISAAYVVYSVWTGGLVAAFFNLLWLESTLALAYYIIFCPASYTADALIWNNPASGAAVEPIIKSIQ